MLSLPKRQLVDTGVADYPLRFQGLYKQSMCVLKSPSLYAMGLSGYGFGWKDSICGHATLQINNYVRLDNYLGPQL